MRHWMNFFASCHQTFTVLCAVCFEERRNEEKVVTPHRKNLLTWCIQMHHVIGLKQTHGIKNVTPRAGKQFVGVAVSNEE
jgi:hypothetical protein